VTVFSISNRLDQDRRNHRHHILLGTCNPIGEGGNHDYEVVTHDVYTFNYIRGLFDNVYKIVSVNSTLIVFACDTWLYEYYRYCKFQLNMFTRKKVTQVLLTYGNKDCRAPNEK